MEPAKRQRTELPPQDVAADNASTGLADKKYNGPCCGGDKLAGIGPGYKLVLVTQIGMAKRIKASWVDKDGRLVATKCGKCKKIILPTRQQLDRIERFKLKSAHDEVQLSQMEKETGFSAEECMALVKVMHEAM